VISLKRSEVAISDIFTGFYNISETLTEYHWFYFPQWRSTERIHAGHAECSYSALLALGETPIFGEGQFLRVDEFFAHNIKVTEMVLKHNATHATLDKNIPWSCLFIFHKLALHIHPRSASRISMSSENVAAVDAKNSCAFRFFLCLR
jgi:hypothetical protein